MSQKSLSHNNSNVSEESFYLESEKFSVFSLRGDEECPDFNENEEVLANSVSLFNKLLNNELNCDELKTLQNEYMSKLKPVKRSASINPKAMKVFIPYKIESEAAAVNKNILLLPDF